LQHKYVKWFSDSQSCVQIINAGSTKPELQDLALKIFQICLERKIDLRVQWIPRSQNQIADYLSKMGNSDDWEVSQYFFDFIDKLWGPHDVDRFANSHNKKVARYNSKLFEPDSEAVDAFTVDWRGSNNWLVPPIALVSKAVFHLLSCGASGTLIVPRWPSAGFWPVLFRENFSPKAFISDVLEFEKGQNIFLHNDVKCVFNSNRFNSKVLAIRLD